MGIPAPSIRVVRKRSQAVIRQALYIYIKSPLSPVCTNVDNPWIEVRMDRVWDKNARPRANENSDKKLRESLRNFDHDLRQGPAFSAFLGFQTLFGMAGRSQVAKEASSALADKLLVTHPSLPLRRLERSSYDRFIRNVQPYAPVLVHCLECYRDGLASCVFIIHHTTSIAWLRWPCTNDFSFARR